MSLTGPVSVRELDQSPSFPGVLTNWHQRVALIKLESDAPSFPVGTLIEFECGSLLFLGQVLESETPHLSVVVEHSIDRDRLTWVNKVWQRSERS